MGRTNWRTRPKTISVRSIAERLKQDIIKGALQPNQRMIEDDLAKRFAVSRTPIREAMRTLESVGYVTFTPHRGWKVKEISVDEVQEVNFIRANLAAASTELACLKQAASDLAALEKICSVMIRVASLGNVGEYFSLNVKFHRLISKVAGNKTLGGMIGSLDERTLRYRFLALSLPGRLAESLGEHMRILAAFKKGDPDEAAKAAKESALRSGSLLTEHLLRHNGMIRV